MAVTVRQAIMTSNLTVYTRTGIANMNAQDGLINGVDENISFSSSSTPDVDSPPYTADLNLTGGTDTIDLLDGLTDPDGVAINLNGKKVRAIKFKAPAANAGNVTITYGASNAYLLLGAAWKIILSPGQSALFYLENDAVTIDATHCNIDYSGTLNDDLEVVAIFG